MELAIMIPMTDQHAAERLAPNEWESYGAHWNWPEEHSPPMFERQIAAEVSAGVEDYAKRHDRAVIVTRSPIVVLRVRRMIAEGTNISAAVYVVTAAGQERHAVLRDGDIPTWPKGLFEEILAESLALAAARGRKR